MVYRLDGNIFKKVPPKVNSEAMKSEQEKFKEKTISVLHREIRLHKSRLKDLSDIVDKRLKHATVMMNSSNVANGIGEIDDGCWSYYKGQSVVLKELIDVLYIIDIESK